MKSSKGLFLTIGICLVAFTGLRANSTTNVIKDDIFTAIRSIDYVSINILLSDGVNIDTVDQDGNTPLMVAAQVGNPRIVDIILNHKPDVNLQNKNGDTALIIAAKTGQLEIVKKLVSHEAYLSTQNNDGNTAVTLASKFGHNEIVSYLKKTRTQRAYTK
ncbi:MAG TPA: ankyrin repeat domain-containing protein [Balneolaceae bacterium]|nr:ankyrin repeat domain-containing protein [Balneolaceae bacterium]